MKLHLLLIALRNLAILNQHIAKGTRHDSPILTHLLKPIPKGRGDTCLDHAYLSRRNCNLIGKKGRSPVINPNGTQPSGSRAANHGVTSSPYGLKTNPRS